MKARIILAFLTTAGLFYVNIMPTIVSGLIEALGFATGDGVERGASRLADLELRRDSL